MADALQHLIREALDRSSEIALGRLLSFSYWGLGYPGESGGVRQVSLSTLVRQQVARFMEGTDLPAVKVTTRRRDGVRGRDETLKRRVAAKFAKGDVSGAVTELRSAEGLGFHSTQELAFINSVALVSVARSDIFFFRIQLIS